MMYRDLQEAQERMGDLQTHLRAAFGAADMRVLVQHVNAAQAVANQLSVALQSLGENRSPGEPEPGQTRAQHGYAGAAAQELDRAVTHLQRAGMADSVTDAQSTLFDVKTHADLADGYLRVATDSIGA